MTRTDHARVVLGTGAVVLAIALAAAACGGPSTTSIAVTQSLPELESPSGVPEVTGQGMPDDGTGSKVLGRGKFERIGYGGSGIALVEQSPGGIVVRFEDFEVEQGPALRVYLSKAAAGSPESRYDDEFVDLGELESFRGDQEYPVPGGTKVEGYRSVVIWCAEFDVGFVVAPITEE